MTNIFFMDSGLEKNSIYIAWVWRNDNITREMSYYQKPIEWNTFYSKYKELYLKANIKPVFALYNDDKIGFVSFTENYGGRERDIEININLNPLYRGQGFGIIVLSEAIKHIYGKYGDLFDIIWAEIKQSNISSVKVFERAGFKLYEQRKKTVNNGYKEEEIDIFVYSFRK